MTPVLVVAVKSIKTVTELELPDFIIESFVSRKVAKKHIPACLYV
jgi:hypothetical protein